MNSFQDNTGRLWTVQMSLGRVDKVLAATGVDLLQPGKPDDSYGNAYIRWNLDDLTFVKFLYHLVDGDKPSPDEWLDLFEPSTIQQAWEVFDTVYENFIQARQRAWVIETVAASRIMVTELTSEKPSGE